MTLLKLPFIFIISGSLLSCSAVQQKTSEEQIPRSDFSHIMPIIDSTAFEIMRQDSFLTNTFSFAVNDTMMSSVYSLYCGEKIIFFISVLTKAFLISSLGLRILFFSQRNRVLVTL